MSFRHGSLAVFYVAEKKRCKAGGRALARSDSVAERVEMSGEMPPFSGIENSHTVLWVVWYRQTTAYLPSSAVIVPAFFMLARAFEMDCSCCLLPLMPSFSMISPRVRFGVS